MVYDLRDMGEAAVGAFSAVLIFFAIRQGDPLSVEPLVGFVIGLFWLGLIFFSNRGPKRMHRETAIHFFGNLLVVMILTIVLSAAFKVGAVTNVLSFEYFGSAAWIATWIGMPLATLFDMNNFTNVLHRYYAHKRK